MKIQCDKCQCWVSDDQYSVYGLGTCENLPITNHPEMSLDAKIEFALTNKNWACDKFVSFNQTLD